MPRRHTVLALLATLVGTPLPAAENPPPPRIDVLLRLKDTDLSANPTVRAALDRALVATRGTPQFLELVRAFNLKDQSAGLLALAAAHPNESVGAEALQQIVENGGSDAIAQALAGPDAAGIARALGNVADEAAAALLVPIAGDSAHPLPVREAAVRSLARSENGAGALLSLARSGGIAAELKPLAATELAAVRWTEIREEAARLLPIAPAAGTIPALETVLALRGDAVRGRRVFEGAAACATCHQVNGQGIDFGPNLSEIGDKFNKQALYAAIVDPNAGVAFGSELWELTLRNGTVFGFVVSETDNEISVKAPGNIVTRHRKTEVIARKSVPGSIMPAGLLLATGPQEVADLLEYLSSLRKVGGPATSPASN